MTSEYERYAADRDKRAEELHGTVLRVLKRDAARAAAEKAAQRGTVAASAAVTDGDTPLMTFRSEEPSAIACSKRRMHTLPHCRIRAETTRGSARPFVRTLSGRSSQASPERARAAAKPPPPREVSAAAHWYRRG